MKMVLLTNIVSTTGIEKLNTHTHTHTHTHNKKNRALIRDGGWRVMKMVPILNIATPTMDDVSLTMVVNDWVKHPVNDRVKETT